MEADAIHPNLLVAKELKRIYTLNRKFVDLRLDDSPYEDLLKNLGNPHLNLPPVIHVAGTNGKGSTIAMLRSILEESGYKVHVYTSPHLITFNERIRVAGELITDEMLLEYIEIVDKAAPEHVTFFEYTSALAFKIFSDIPADMFLLEVGLGGRLDCSNIIQESLLSVITKIGLDHTEYLGETVAEIAAEKAGIIKEYGDLVLAPQDEDKSVCTINDIAQKKNATFTQAKLQEGYETNLVGAHQQKNIATVLAVLDRMKDHFIVTDAQIKKALMHVDWPARMQNVSMQINLGEGYDVWLDGGHNPDAAKVLAEQMQEWKRFNDKPIVLIIGMQSKKDCRAFVRPLLPFVGENIWCVDNLFSNFPQSAEELAKNINLPCKTVNTYKDALAAIQEKYDSAHILIAGSLYLAGNVLADL